MCGNQECQCQGPHRKHAQLPLQGFLERTNEPPNVPEDLKRAEKTMNGLIDNMVSIIDRCRDKHRRLVIEYVTKHYQFAWLR
jgi:hypothetical protein